MDRKQQVENEKSIELTIDVNSVFNYALQQNHVAFVRSVTVKNITEKDIENVVLKISTEIDLIEPFEESIDILQPGEEKTFKNFKLKIHGNYLATLTERVSCLLFVDIMQNSVELATASEEITVLAYDQWPGLRYDADLLAAYVTPNHPEIKGLMQSASKYLEKWTGDPTLNGYQSLGKDDGTRGNRVLLMACAAYAAIQEKNITYAEPPASYEDVGQRIRLADDILSTHLATCMDMTLMYAGLLEAMGLNALLVMVKGHIFAGVWLVDDSFPDPCTDDPTQLEKRVADGINEITLVECTAMCAGNTYSFDDAELLGMKNVEDYSSFEFAIDLSRARRSGVRPLPIRTMGNTSVEVIHEDRSEESITAATTHEVNTIDWDVKNPSSNITKQTQWERKLLDLSMRNMLINMRIKSSVVPLLISDAPSLEDNLFDGEEYEILSRPKEWDIHNISVGNMESVGDLGPYADLIDLEMKHHRIHAWLSEAELNKLLTKMYRSARTSMEENGASTLYMTMGLLRWTDAVKSAKVHYAPIVLVPIDIKRKGASKGYTIRKREEDAHINITLLEFLKQNFNMEIPGLNPLPMDEHGLDVAKVFAIFRRAIMDKKLWNIIENSFIGNFSFSQFVMWNDIHSRADLLKENKLVNALMEGNVDWNTTLPENVDTDNAYLPVSVDASQIHAINMAANNVSFVLHGPPGTGKSQTITAMIANALAKGKTVLFVAEKMAALEVVQKRLASLGIQDFCLELHSNKAIKKNVLEQLKRGLDIAVWGFSTDYDEKIEEIHQLRTELDEYVKKLHERRKYGMSVRELIDLYESIPEQKEKIRFKRSWISTLEKKDLDNHRHLLEQLVSAGKVIGHPKENVFSRVNQTEYSQSLRYGLEDGLYDYEKAIDAVSHLEDVPEFILSGELNQNTIEILKEYERKKASLSILDDNASKKWTDKIYEIDLSSFSVQFDEKCNVKDRLQNSLDELGIAFLEYYDSKNNKYKKTINGMLEKWQESFLQMSMDSYIYDIEAAQKKLFGKKKAINDAVENVRRYAKFPITVENLVSELNLVTDYQQFMKEVDAFNTASKEFVDVFMDGNSSIAALRGIYIDHIDKQNNDSNVEFDFDECISRVISYKKMLSSTTNDINDIVAYIQSCAVVPITEKNLLLEIEVATLCQKEALALNSIEKNIPEKVRKYIEFNGSAESLERIKDTFDQLQDAENTVSKLLQMNLVTTGDDWLEKKKDNCEKILAHLSELKDWINFREIMKKCEDANLQDICNLYVNGLPHECVLDVYYKSIYKAIIVTTIDSEPVLNRFNGTRFNERIKQYKQLEQEFLDLTKEEMYYKLTHQLPTGRESAEIGKEMAILRKAITSRGRGLSIRSLFDQIPHILTKLCPCFLMSPISVAQYLSIDNDLFDIVIFDEASQLPTCKAVGVLARGKNAVIVGDPNQMPPTSFFAGNMIDEDNLDIEDLDSILDDCLALGIPDAHLQWHYRSKHESLIAFSNQEYYENSMLTFPSINDRERRVKLCTVNGTFNRKKGRINEEEGKAVVKEILRRYNDEELNKQSIGVVTFNISQQGLIEDLLTEEFRKDTKFDAWANEREEKLFVKNLENVQGDERDVILFSVGFGPDEDGKVSLNFGPLNREGGWKRLNVAVSRARSEMIVFSSMLPEMIDLNRTKAKGVEGLRAFLEFAQKGRLSAKFSSGMTVKTRGIQNQIISAIEEKGLKCQKDVGHSDFKIDIAVINPFDENEYLLGILLDGDTYKRSSTTKDREISQISVLEGLGWKLHRIWAMDWWDNKEKELTAIMALIDEATEKAKETDEVTKPKNAGPESEEIIKRQKVATIKKGGNRQKREQIEGNSSFETHERFTPKIPHTDSKDEFQEFLKESTIDNNNE